LDPRSSAFDPADYVQPVDVAARLGEWWRTDVNETRERSADPSHGPPHALDTVLQAYRLR
jgi:hypothetical protein